MNTVGQNIMKWLDKIFGSSAGADVVEDIARLNNRARKELTFGQYEQAAAFYQRVLAIREKNLGPDHPDVGESLLDLAGIYSELCQRELAEPLYQRALAIKEKALGPDHPDVAMILENMVALYRKIVHEQEAESLAQRAAAIRAIKR
jgi:tetratricopeptide (TPR) repeat protein